jgi:hypothetical protein
VEKKGTADLESQCVPTVEESWEMGAYKAFLEGRRKALVEVINAFLTAKKEGR